jgi:hypothetical protein
MLLTLAVAAAVIAVVLFLFLREGIAGKDAPGMPPRPGMTGVRRSPRVPISIPVAIHTFEDSFEGKGQNISYGGMLIKAQAPLSVAQPIEVNFTLPDAGAIRIPAVISYKKGEALGLRFDPTHHDRHPIREWVDNSVKEQGKVAVGNPSEGAH